MQENILLIMPYVEVEFSLNELFSRDAKRFKSLYVKMLFECTNIIRTSYSSDCFEKMQYTGQTLELMSKWCDDIDEKYRGIELLNDVNGKKYNISEQIRKAKRLINLKPEYCVLFNGDLNLHNVLCANSGIKYIDFEYWGYYDLDYVVAKIIGSLYKHCKCLKVTKYCVDQNEFCIRYYVDEIVKQLFSIDLYMEAFVGVKVNYERVKAYILAKLYFRFMAAYDNWQIKNGNNQSIERAIEELAIVLGVLDLFNN